MDGICVLAPLWEFVGVQGELLLQLGNICGIFVEQDSSVSGLEAVESLFRPSPCLRGGNGLHGWLDDFFPELGVLIAQEDDDAS